MYYSIRLHTSGERPKSIKLPHVTKIAKAADRNFILNKIEKNFLSTP
jgi:hypothetical protein